MRKYTDAELDAKFKRRRRELAEFDKLPLKEQQRRTAQGLNPHEPLATRKAKQARIRAEIEKRMDKLPKEERDRLTALGVYRSKAGAAIRRMCGSIEAKK